MIWDVESGREQKVLQTSSWSPQKIAWAVNNMGCFVVNIWVVADQNTFNQPATSVIDSHLASVSARLRRSLFWKMKLSISARKSSALPISWLTDIKKVIYLIDLCIIWCVDDHHILTSRINISTCRSVISCACNDKETKSIHCCFLWGLDRTVWTILWSYKLSWKSTHNDDMINRLIPCLQKTECFLINLAQQHNLIQHGWPGCLRYHLKL